MHARALLPPLALLLASCPKSGTLDKVSEALEPYLPTVKFQDLSLRDIDWEHVEVDLQFRVDNPAPLQVKLASLSYALSLEGTSVLEGTMKDGLSLPAQDAATLTVPMSLQFDDIRSLLGSTRGKDELGFVLSGKMGFDTPVGVAKVPYTAKGDFPVLRTPKVALKKVKVTDLSLVQDQASLNVVLDVWNKGEASIGLSDFDYQFSLNGSKVASGTVASLGDAAAGESVVKLPIDVKLSGAAGALLSLLQKGGETDAKLAASFTVTTPFGELPLSVDESGDLQVVKAD
jgi:LEA14-like dessication related protein